MKDLVFKYKREFVYCCYLFLIFELLTTPAFLVMPYIFVGTALVGLLLLVLWIYMVHIVHKAKTVKTTAESSILMHVSIRQRIFTNVIMPIVFYFSIVCFLFVDVSMYLNQLVIVLSVVMLFFLMLHIRTSYEKIYSIEKVTRYIYDFVNIIIYFILSSVLVRLGLDPYIISIILLLFSYFVFYYLLVAHRKLDSAHLILAFFACLIVVTTFFSSFMILAISAAVISTIVLYTLISLINLRFGGHRKLEEYIPTLMYSLMAIILVLSL